MARAGARAGEKLALGAALVSACVMGIPDLAQRIVAALQRGVERGMRGSLPAPAPSAAAAPGPAGSIQPGAQVLYRQGRGTFLARVVSVNRRESKATVERTSDGKRVTRPLDKLKAAR